MPQRPLNLFLSVLVLLLSSLACSLLSTAGSGSGSPTAEGATPVVDKSLPTLTIAPPTEVIPTSTPPQAAATGDPLKILKQVPDKLAALKSYRIKGQITGGSDPAQDGPLLEEVIPPDRLHLVLPSLEYYSIGSTAYYKLGANAAWMKGAQLNTGGSPLGAAVIDPLQMIANAVKQNGVNLGQPATLNGKPMLLYNFTATATDPNSSTGSLWVGLDDGLPYKLLDLEQDGTNVELNYYDFNASFKIVPPIP